MEEDIYQSKSLIKRNSESVLKLRLEEAVDSAEERIKYEAAHNEDLLKALSIVKMFIKKYRRVCYGGTAMNAILPIKSRFYNPELDLPDYDFFTPDIERDTAILVKELRAAGFNDVIHRVGVHEGTKKILVNFIPIADISRISSNIYSVFYSRSIIKDGIHYTDPDLLRMMMYLELSRPKGMVSRWGKVYERLQLINSSFPPKRIGRGQTRKFRPRVPVEIQKLIYKFGIESQLIFFTGRLEKFYRSIIHGKNRVFDLNACGGCIGLFSASPTEDANAIKQILKGEGLQVITQLHKAKGDIVPMYIDLHVNGVVVAIILQEVACHSNLVFPTSDGRNILVASPDTLITLYYSIILFTKSAAASLRGIGTDIPKLVDLVEYNRRMKTPAIPPYSTNCRGYQKGWSTLLREKYTRILSEKDRASEKMKEVDAY